jgi:hypothetical protein
LNFFELALGITFRGFGIGTPEVRSLSDGSVEATANYRFQACADLLKVLDYVAPGFRALLRHAPTWVKVRLLSAAETLVLRRIPNLMRLVGFPEKFAELIDIHVSIWVGEAIKAVASGGNIPADACTDTWTPTVAVTVSPSGSIGKSFTSESTIWAVSWGA